ncbi:MAG TPA: hypothetical protein ENI39_07055 [Anaerolineae bacterium]|nr:hypothetical protein [Anaerolineae bacterium]
MAQIWGPSSGRPVPRLLASLLCEDAATSSGLADGRVTLQRVFFDLYADAFPAGFDRLTVVNFWAAGEASGRAAVPAHRVTVRIVAPDGAEVARGEAELAFPAGAVTVVQVVYFPGLVLPEPGRCTVEVSLDDAAVHTYTLHVTGLAEEEVGDESR